MRQQNGFTLTELIATITIAAILAAAAIPSFRGMMQNNRITTATNTLIGSLALARSEAIKRQAEVVLCLSGDPTATPPACGGGTASDWSTGWVLFVNVDEDSPPTFDGGVADILIKVGEGVTGDLSIKSNAAAASEIEYAANGAIAGGTSRFAVCDSRGEESGRQIDISTLGRSELHKGTAGTPITDCDAPT